MHCKEAVVASFKELRERLCRSVGVRYYDGQWRDPLLCCAGSVEV